MAQNYGLLNDFAQGIKEGLIGYQTIQKNKRDQQQFDLLHGTRTNEAGDLEFDPQVKQQMDAKRKAELVKSQSEVSGSSADSIDSSNARSTAKGLLKRAVPGMSEEEINSLVPDTMTKNEILQDQGLIGKAISGGFTMQGNQAKLAQQKEQFQPAGSKAKDTAFAKEYVDWNAAGGLAGIEKQLVSLEDAAQKLEKNPGITGPGKGLAGKLGLRSFTNPEAAALKQQVEQAVQGTLRATLGPQFTENEGLAIMARAYDENLPAEQNIIKLRRELNYLRDLASSKEEASKYFEQHGTLDGFKPAQARSSGLLKKPVNSELTPDVVKYANDHGITPEAALALKKQRTGGQ